MIQTMNTYYEIKIFDILTPELETKVAELDSYKDKNERIQSPQEKAIHQDKYHSADDIFQYLFAFEDDKIIARMRLYYREIKFQEIENEGKIIKLGGIGGVRTRPDKRKQGIATNMLTLASKLLQEKGCDIAHLCTDIKNPARIRLYGKIGFVVLDKPYTYLGKSGKRYTDQDGMIAPINSETIFHQIVNDKSTIWDIGNGNW